MKCLLFMHIRLLWFTNRVVLRIYPTLLEIDFSFSSAKFYLSQSVIPLLVITWKFIKMRENNYWFPQSVDMTIIWDLATLSSFNPSKLHYDPDAFTLLHVCLMNLKSHTVNYHIEAIEDMKKLLNRSDVTMNMVMDYHIRTTSKHHN